MTLIRQATKSDVSQIHTLGESVPEFSVNDATINFWPKKIIEDCIKSDEAIVLVAEEGTELQGFIIANCNIAFKKVIIENIYVTPSYRGHGVGEKLLNAMVSSAQEREYHYIATLIPVDAREASTLYINTGFTKGEVFQWLDRTLSKNFTPHSSDTISL